MPQIADETRLNSGESMPHWRIPKTIPWFSGTVLSGLRNTSQGKISSEWGMIIFLAGWIQVGAQYDPENQRFQVNGRNREIR